MGKRFSFMTKNDAACACLSKKVERYEHRIHAFCLMGNHIHLLIQAGNTPLSKVVHNLTFRYSQFFSRRHKKIGHLFQGMFKAILIQEKAYFLRLLRYIHMNPVRSHLVQVLADYPWSVHSAYLGQMEFVWLITEYGLEKFSDRLVEARLKYRNYVLKDEPQNNLIELRQGFIDGQILGDDNFLKDFRNSQNDQPQTEIPLQGILNSICQVYDVDETSLSSPLRSDHLSLARRAATTFARKQGRSLKEMAKVFKRDGNSLGRLMQRFLQKYACSVAIQKQYLLFEKAATSFAVMQA